MSPDCHVPGASDPKLGCCPVGAVARGERALRHRGAPQGIEVVDGTDVPIQPGIVGKPPGPKLDGTRGGFGEHFSINMCPPTDEDHGVPSDTQQ
eukprot:scaffold149035_cov47-Prasinocladus_malaysianus.AAC.1